MWPLRRGGCPSFFAGLAFFLALTAADGWAQTATLRGFVTSAGDQEALPGVNVVLEDGAGGRYGTATNTDGFYTIARVPAGTYRLRATFVGFVPYEADVTLIAGQILTLNFSLAEDQAQLDEVVIESERETAGGAALSAGLQTVRPRDIALVPAPDISADLVNYLTVMPGVISQGDRGGQLFIRGGEPTQNMVLLDGMLVYQPFHVVGFFSAFPSEIINTAEVYAGGYGGRYGGRLSSVIDIGSRNGNKNRFSGAVSVAPFVSTARIEGPIVPGTVSVLASVRQDVIEQGAAQIVDDPLPFRFADRFAKVHANLGESSQFSVTALHTEDRGRLGVDPLAEDPEALPEDEVFWENLAVGGRLIFLPASLPIFATVQVSTSRLDNGFGIEADPERETRVQQTGGSADITYYAGSFDLNWGLFVNTTSLKANLGGQFQNVVIRDEFVTEAGAYLEPEIRLGGGLRLQPGLRLHAFPSKDHTFIEPRFRMRWEQGIHRFSAAAGLYHQEVVGLNDRRDAGDIFTAWTASPFGKVPEALHLIAGWRVQPTPWLDLSVEGFYKKLSNIFIPEWTAFPRFTTNLQQADGRVRGLDLRLELKAGFFYSLLSYGLSEVTYDAEIPAVALLYGEEETSYAPPHDRRHQVNALVAVSQFGFDLNVRWQFGSGLPFNKSMGFDRFILLDSLRNLLEVPGDERVLYERPYTGRLPAYHRLDVSLERAFELGGSARLTLQGGLINAYDRPNLFYLDLFTLRRVDQLPLIPTLGIKLEI
ncbi:MAG: TonB-dependent receptor [Fimbriimonadales bacterium]|nr:MAG: TonB-dependent receptor [Fimbriimonadales bacterium]